jgi:hypothetical protein
MKEKQEERENRKNERRKTGERGIERGRGQGKGDESNQLYTSTCHSYQTMYIQCMCILTWDQGCVVDEYRVKDRNITNYICDFKPSHCKMMCVYMTNEGDKRGDGKRKYKEKSAQKTNKNKNKNKHTHTQTSKQTKSQDEP